MRAIDTSREVLALWEGRAAAAHLQSHHLQSHHTRHRLSRRAFLGGAAAGAAILGASGIRPAAALRRSLRDTTPKPTTNVVSINGLDFSLTAFGSGMDPAVIADFNGAVGVAQVQGTGTGTNPDGSTETLLFDTDMRFMRGVYVGVDGATHHGTFGFV